MVKDPFEGKCLAYANDPSCEAAKAAQNAQFQAEYSAARLECERLKVLEQRACQTQVDLKKAACIEGRDAVLESSQKTHELLTQLSQAAAGKDHWEVDAAIKTLVNTNVKDSDLGEVLLYKTTGPRSIMAFLLSYIDKSRVIEYEPLRLLGIGQLSDGNIIMAGASAYFRPGHEPTIGDLIQIAVASVFYKRLGLDGIAPLMMTDSRTTGQIFDLAQEVDYYSIEICTRLQDLDFECSSEVELHRVDGPS